MFGLEPSVVKGDYVKWIVEEPAVNFAISTREDKEGLNHFGLQSDSDEELQVIADRLNKADIQTTQQDKTACCYSESNKHWAFDPQGIAWESFTTLSDIPTFGDDSGEVPKQEKAANNNNACNIPKFGWDKVNSGGCCL